MVYKSLADARLAIREFDGANANGQPIRLTLLPTAPSIEVRGRGGGASTRNPFDTVERPSRSLFDRIEDPKRGRDSRTRGGRSRSRSPGRPRRSDTSKPAPEGVDRYVPPPNGKSRARSRSPRRRDGGERARGRGGREALNGRPKKTQEELDQEMEDYWGPAGRNEGAGANTATANGVATASAAATAENEDIDMAVE